MGENKNIYIHWFWAIILLAGLFLVRYYYVGQLDKQQERHEMENARAIEVTKAVEEQKKQVMDGRSGMELGAERWREVSGSPVATYELIKYLFQGSEVKLNSGKVFLDTVTGLVWSEATTEPMDNLFTIEGEGVVGTGAVGFCEILKKNKYGGYTSWRLPTQKQLMQAYIDGIGGVVLDRPSYFWSATEFVGDGTRAWRVNLQAGDVTSSPKNQTSSNYVICVSDK